MIRFLNVCFLLACALVIHGAEPAVDLQAELSASDFAAIGLDRLDPGQLERLNRWIEQRLAQSPAQQPTTDSDAAAAPLPGSVAATDNRPVSAPPASADPVPPEQHFGSEHLAESQSFSSPRSMITTIPGRFTGWDGTTVFRLANGQVWRQTDSSRFRFVTEDPTVIVERGAMGAYYLRVEGKNTVVRIRRLR